MEELREERTQQTEHGGQSALADAFKVLSLEWWRCNPGAAEPKWNFIVWVHDVK